MENKDKYYTPKIEQIVYGFHYELLTDDGDWVMSNVPQDTDLLNKMIKSKRCRAISPNYIPSEKESIENERAYSDKCDKDFWFGNDRVYLNVKKDSDE